MRRSHSPPSYVKANLDVVDYLIDLLYDRNIEIRKVCDASLGIISVFLIHIGN
jgi:hypothetical protein